MPASLPIAGLPARVDRLRSELVDRLEDSEHHAARAIVDLARRRAARGPSGLAASIEARGSSVVSTHPAAAALERGEVRGRPWLAVPIGAGRPGSPRGDGDLAVVRDRGGRLYLMDRRTREMRWRLIERVRPAVVRPIGAAVDEATDQVLEIVERAGRGAVAAT